MMDFFNGTFGKDKTKTKSSSVSTSAGSSTMTLDPALSGALYGNLARTQGVVDQGYTPYSGVRVAAFNADQLAGQSALRSIYDNNVGAGLLDDAATAARGAASYQPGMITAGRLAEIDLAPYQNPYESQVVQTTLSDIARQRQIAGIGDKAEAISAGAFGGAREGVQRALTTEGYDRNAFQSVGALRHQGYLSAQQAAEADLSRRLNADTANQAAGLQGAQLRASAAGLLGNLSQQQLEQAVARAGLLGNIGEAQQALAQRQADAAYADWQYGQERPLTLQALLNQSLGLLPTYGTTNTTGRTTEDSRGLSTRTYAQLSGGVGSKG